MTLAEAQELMAEWERHPPASISLAKIEAMIAAWLGVRRAPSGAAPASAPGSFEQAQSALAEETQHSGGMFAFQPPGDAKDDLEPIYDFEALKAKFNAGG